MNNQASNAEKRQFSRIAFDSPVTLSQEGKSWESKLIDISLKGALISRPENWDEAANDSYQLAINLDGSDVEIDMDVKITHSEEERIGFHCEQIDLDSVSKLRRLVELNIGDEDLLEREISNMLSQ